LRERIYRVDEFIELMSLQQHTWTIPYHPPDEHLELGRSYLTNSLRIAQDFLRGLSLWLEAVGQIFRAQRRALRAGVFVSAMTPIIFIAIGFLGCWFLLYALMVWTQGPQRRFSATCEQTGESITGASGPARA
jgi:hypothetical protein